MHKFNSPKESLEYLVFLILCTITYQYSLVVKDSYSKRFFLEKATIQKIQSSTLEIKKQLSEENYKFSFCFIFGHDLGFNKNLKKLLHTYNLEHILSPSAMHIAPLLYFSKLILPSHLYNSLLILFISILGYKFKLLHPAIIRVLEWGFFSKLINQNKKDNVDIKWIFLIVFQADFFFGSWRLLPLSYIFTLTILGHMYFLPHQMSLPVKLGISQIFLSFFTNVDISILNLVIGQIFTFFFFIIYCFTISLYFLNFSLQMIHLDYLMQAPSYFLNEIISFYFLSITETTYFTGYFPAIPGLAYFIPILSYLGIKNNKVTVNLCLFLLLILPY